MQFRIDYHVHTDNSYDCKVPMEDMCVSAIRLGVKEIAFTDHLNNHPMDTDLGFYNPERYFDDIARCRALYPALTIRAGVELGEPHRWSRKLLPILEKYPYDVVLGSLHWVGNDSMFNPNYFRGHSEQEAYGAYFSELVQMIEFGGFDILAHVDLPKRVGTDVYGPFDSAKYQDQLCAVWQACIDHNITPEINTKGLHGSMAQLHPTTEALRWYADMGGQLLSFGSDAHRSESIVQDFDAARQSALDVGFRYTCRYEKRTFVGWNEL